MSDTSPLQKLPNSIDTAISNLTGPITQTAGETIRDCWDLIFGGLRNVAEKKRLKYAASVEQLKKELESKIEDIPANKRTEPDIQVVCGALSDAQYCVDKDELRNRYCLELLHFFCVNAVAVRGFQVPEQRPGRCVESQLANRAYHQQQRNNDQNYSHF